MTRKQIVLCKDVCKACKNSNAFKERLNCGWFQNDEEWWHQGMVFCAMAMQTENTKAPPHYCPYPLEHVVMKDIEK